MSKGSISARVSLLEETVEVLLAEVNFFFKSTRKIQAGPIPSSSSVKGCGIKSLLFKALALVVNNKVLSFR